MVHVLLPPLIRLIRLEIRIVPVMEIRIVKQIKNLFTLTAGKRGVSGEGARASDAGSPDEIRARFKADEINRALRARSDKTNFDSTKNTVAGSGNAYAPAASFTGNRTNAQRISDINAEQNGLQERIQMMESKVRADEAALPSTTGRSPDTWGTAICRSPTGWSRK